MGHQMQCGPPFFVAGGDLGELAGLQKDLASLAIPRRRRGMQGSLPRFVFRIGLGELLVRQQLLHDSELTLASRSVQGCGPSLPAGVVVYDALLILFNTLMLEEARQALWHPGHHHVEAFLTGLCDDVRQIRSAERLRFLPGLYVQTTEEEHLLVRWNSHLEFDPLLDVRDINVLWELHLLLYPLSIDADDGDRHSGPLRSRLLAHGTEGPGALRCACRAALAWCEKAGKRPELA
mmetsp:Transcript_94156/g.202087  ORF Transcript_94156/g.202087 Transcript_94156/m.202087 type:complete len:235 (+) Transcript_94156:712-1416(+)